MPPRSSRLPVRPAAAVAVAVALATGAGGCAWMYPTTVPLSLETHRASPTERAPILLVLLPGRGDSASDFAKHGFIDDVRGSGLAVDVVAADAHFGYYVRETIVDRVWTDVVEPARRQGYRHIWIGGMSMGGIGSIVNARAHPDAYERMLVLAPYLGPKDLLQQIEAPGGPARWTPTDLTDPYQRVWTWLKQYTDPRLVTGLPEMTLGFGTDDKLVRGIRVLTPALASDHVTEVPGKHDWETWRRIWKSWWAPGGLATRPRAAPVLTGSISSLRTDPAR